MRFGFAALERAAFWPRLAQAEFQAQAVRQELVVRRGARLGRGAPGSAASLVGPLAPWDAGWLRAGWGALSRAAHAGAARPAASGAAAGLQLAAVPLAAPEAVEVLRREAQDAAEVQHGAARRALLLGGDLLVLLSAAAFRVPSHDRVRLAPVRPEQEASGRAMLNLRTAWPSEPSWQAARDEVLS